MLFSGLCAVYPLLDGVDTGLFKLELVLLVYLAQLLLSP